MKFDRRDLSPEELLQLYRALIKPRVIEERMLVLLRQGKIGKWFSGIGQEAISVGITCALKPEEYIMPLHRNLGVFTTRGIPYQKLFAQWQGKESGFTKGRDRSFHFGTQEYRIVGMISHLGAMLGVANGTALAAKMAKRPEISVAFSGDGGASEGDFHEALNTAAVWNLPVLFVIENNGYGLSTPSQDQFRCKQFIDKGIGYGMEAHQVDGNNILEVYHKACELSESMRSHPRPILLECMTFRMRGHEEASGTKYVPQHLFDEWAVKDPIRNFKQYLLDEGIAQESQLNQWENEMLAELNEAVERVFEEAEPQSNPERELADVYAPVTVPTTSAGSQSRELRLVDAVQDGLKEAMRKHPNLVLMGQDIAEYGGVFKITEGFLSEFGSERVRNTPITESSIVGAAYGLAISGHKAMVEMQFSDFVSCAFNQIANNLAKSHYRWQQAADVVVRMPTGAGVQAGPFHSQSTESWFYHIPGLKIYYPSNPADAKGLLLRAFEDPNPVLFFEHKYLYRSLTGPVPEGYYSLEEGQARVHDLGRDACIITYGWGVHQALAAAEKNQWPIQVIDLCTLLPWDKERVKQAVQDCGKVLLLGEATETGSLLSDISAWIAEHAFEHLDAPIVRLGSLDTPIPLAKNLEDGFLPWQRLEAAMRDLLAY
ncbi:MAG: alpha-ketoacid dehydrogenase subunit alpha/beta [Bacteroidia bacterium]